MDRIPTTGGESRWGVRRGETDSCLRYSSGESWRFATKRCVTRLLKRLGLHKGGVEGLIALPLTHRVEAIIPRHRLTRACPGELGAIPHLHRISLLGWCNGIVLLLDPNQELNLPSSWIEGTHLHVLPLECKRRTQEPVSPREVRCHRDARPTWLTVS